MRKQTVTTAAIVGVVVGLISTSALAAPGISYDEVPLTQTELDDNWIVDRAVPSGGYESVSIAGRDNVLEMRVDPDNRSTGSGFFHTEGLQRQTPGAAALRMDLFVDPEWEGKDIRAGLWGVGHDESGVRTAFPIIEYHQNTDTGFAGWRVWDSSIGSIGDWISHGGTAGFGDWATLEVVLDTENNEFILSVDGVAETITGLDSATLGEVIVNMFNYGPGTPGYDVHFSDFAIGESLTSKDDCKKDGYADFGFENQGLCIASLVSNK